MPSQMTGRKTFDEHVAGAVATNELVVQLVQPAPSLFPRHAVLEEPAAAVAYVAWVHPRDAAEQGHTVVVCYWNDPYSGGRYEVYCSDKFIGPQLDAPQALAHAEHCCSRLPVGARAGAVKAMLRLHGVHPTPARCTFWSDFRREGVLCEHTNAMLAHLATAVPGFRDELRRAYDAQVTSAA